MCAWSLGYSRGGVGALTRNLGGDNGVCSASFEAPECQDRYGAPLAAGDIMSRIDAVRTGDAESSRWLDENEVRDSRPGYFGTNMRPFMHPVNPWAWRARFGDQTNKRWDASVVPQCI